MKTLNYNQFIDFLTNHIETGSMQDYTIKMSNPNDDYPMLCFIKYENICDVRLQVFGTFGGFAEVVNMEKWIKATQDIEKVLNVFEAKENCTFKVIEGIEE